MMRKLFCAFFLTVALSGCAFAAENKIDGVWGLNFGAPVDEIHSVMKTKKDAVLLCASSYAPGYSEETYRIDFFGRRGQMCLRFSPKGFYNATFSFVRTEGLLKGTSYIKNSDYYFSRNFRELNSMLMSKYGIATRKLECNGIVRGFAWKENKWHGNTVSLYEDRSATKHDTVLTYEAPSKE